MKNEYTVGENYTTIYTSGGIEVIIDTEDLGKIIKHTWNASSSYPQSRIDKKVIRLHAFLMNPIEGMVVDHINGNILDNRKSNLRICTPQENHQNKKRRKKK